MRRILPVSVAALVVALAALSAASPDKDKGKSKGKGHEAAAPAEEHPGQGDRAGAFQDRDRQVVGDWWKDTYGPDGCPPGLAKKHNGCLPPGQAKKRYAVGQRLPGTVVIQPLPPVLVTRLGPPPAGYEYAVVDGDILKLAIGTRMVVDAIAALVH
jgi:Ni/Co efflux regulator RcnB